MKSNVIREKSFSFAVKIVKYYKYMTDQKEYIISKQLLRSGTSIGANVEEALAGISKRDFTAKMSIASKEARETKYWLRLVKESGLIKNTQAFEELINEVEELINILTAIVKTSQSTISR